MIETYRNTTVVIASSEDEAVFNCIDSVGDDAQIAVAMTPCDSIEQRLSRLHIPHVIVPRGNLGLTFNAAINLAETNKVIIMTDDATFNPGTIEQLSEGLEQFDACKPRIIFEYDPRKPFTKIVAQVRDFANSSPRRAFTPGLALRKDTKDMLGGHFFNEQVKWAEDAEFSYRFHKRGLRFGYLPDATINHPPVTVKHDLRGAFLIGLSKRRAVELGLRHGDEDLTPTIQRLASGETIKRKTALVKKKGVGTLPYALLWDSFYNLGYNVRRAGISSPVEAVLWKNFGRSTRNT